MASAGGLRLSLQCQSSEERCHEACNEQSAEFFGSYGGRLRRDRCLRGGRCRAGAGAGKDQACPARGLSTSIPLFAGHRRPGQTPHLCRRTNAIDEKGALVGKDDPEAQARQVFKNINAVLESAGARMDHVVKITMIVKNAADFPKIGAVRREVFKEPYPASTTFVAALLNPDWLVEVEAFAVVD
jgi:enamine deaminase RidA (YjgF/YER057c/UK114 family)